MTFEDVKRIRKNPTEAEIIKGTECCSAKKLVCADCPYFDTYNCVQNLGKDTIDLINRQKAEIERLQEVHKSLEEAYREQENYENMIIEGAEVCAHCHEEYAEKIKQARAEAIKEFAERLKENTIDVDVSYGYGREHYTEAVAVIEIDNLVKEMAGESNG